MFPSKQSPAGLIVARGLVTQLMAEGQSEAVALNTVRRHHPEAYSLLCDHQREAAHRARFVLSADEAKALSRGRTARAVRAKHAERAAKASPAGRPAPPKPPSASPAPATRPAGGAPVRRHVGAGLVNEELPGSSPATPAVPGRPQGHSAASVSPAGAKTLDVPTGISLIAQLLSAVTGLRIEPVRE